LELAFLGGAGGVGASCLALDLADRRVLIDAGVRMDSTADRLPDLAQLDGRDLAAIFVTHAHADHIGALPLVHQHFPTTPIYASPATIRLIEVMLADALRVMERRATEELEIPLYDAALVASMLRRLRPLPLGEQNISELPNVTISATGVLGRTVVISRRITSATTRSGGNGPAWRGTCLITVTGSAVINPSPTISAIAGRLRATRSARSTNVITIGRSPLSSTSEAVWIRPLAP